MGAGSSTNSLISPISAAPSRSSLRVLYAAGPGDVMGTFRHWREGRDDPSQVTMTCSGMFYDYIRDGGHKAYVISSNRAPAPHFEDGQFIILNRPVPYIDGPGWLYHLSQFGSGIRLTASAVWFRADAVVVSCGTAHWFSLMLLPLFGIKVIPSLHCTMWRANIARSERFPGRYAGLTNSSSNGRRIESCRCRPIFPSRYIRSAAATPARCLNFCPSIASAPKNVPRPQPSAIRSASFSPGESK